MTFKPLRLLIFWVLVHCPLPDRDTRDRCMSSFAQPMSCGSVVYKVRGMRKMALPEAVTAAMLADLIGVRRGPALIWPRGDHRPRPRPDRLRPPRELEGVRRAYAQARNRPRRRERDRLCDGRAFAFDQAQADAQEAKNKLALGSVLDAGEVEKAWSDIMRQSCAAVLAVPARCQQRLPHLTTHDVNEFDLELREALRALGEGGANGAA